MESTCLSHQIPSVWGEGVGFVPCTHVETWASGGHDTFQHGASQLSGVHFQEGGERMEGRHGSFLWAFHHVS